MTQEGRKPLGETPDPQARVSGEPPPPEGGFTDRSTGMKLVSKPRTPSEPGLEHNPTIVGPDSSNPAASLRAPSNPESRPPPPPSARDSDMYLGCTIDNRYKVEALLGEGGMGVVYQCRHKIIDKKVAMKILRSELAREHEVTERFLIEAKAASAIGNEHVIDISDFGQLPDGSAYFVMEFLDGQPLSAVLSAHKSLPAARILHIALQLAKGLEAAHKAGIVHRDLKPDNVFLITRAGDPDFVKVLDFGIAKVSSAATGRLTQAGSVFGTPHYMSPEQAAGAPVDHRGDIYSVGVMLYELATGSLPFQADNFMAILTQHIYKAPASLRSIEPTVPPQLEAIVLKCLSKRPEQRYQSMQELAQDLDAFRSGSIPSAVSEMMERSGGFNVPAEFFKTARSATSPQPAKPRWPLYAGIVAVVAAGAWFLVAQSSSKEAHTAEPVAAAVQPKEAPASTAPTEEVQITSQVVLGIEPSTAHVFQGDKDLGVSPVVVNVPENQQVNVEVRQEGYATQSLKLDGTQQKMSVALEPLKPRHTASKNTAPKALPVDPKQKKPKSGSQIGGGEIVNPWAGG